MREGVKDLIRKIQVTNINIKILNILKKSSSSSEVFGDQRNFHSTSDSSDDNHYTKKRKYKSYEEISGEFKKIKPPTFNGETEKGGEAES